MEKNTEKRLSTTLFTRVLVYSIATVCCFTIIFLALFYFMHENEEESHLLSMARSATTILNENGGQENETLLQGQLDSDIRYTLLDSNGDVLFDSYGATSENHADRPEVQQAIESGEASIMRYSDTLHEDTIYAAVKLDSENILRLSEQRETFVAVVQSMLLPLILSFLLIAAFCVVFTRTLSKKIVAPFQEIDLSSPLKKGVYTELKPVLTRLYDQQQQLIEQNRELDRAENMRREFTANVTHEMKTPIQVISGYAELLSTGLVSPEDAVKFSGIIKDEADNMTNLVDDVLTLSRLDDEVNQNAGKAPVDLFEIAKGVAIRLEPVSEKRDVRLHVYGSDIEIIGNKGLLEQLLLNLMSNALQYSDPGKEVTVFVGKRVAGLEGNDEAEAYVRVRDEGCGIPKDEQEKIFERFYRVDKSRSRESGGTGLGLAIAKHAAQFHDATISVESELQKGSVFTVHFPLHDQMR